MLLITHVSLPWKPIWLFTEIRSSQVSGMGDFFGEMAEMMSQATPTVR